MSGSRSTAILCVAAAVAAAAAALGWVRLDAARDEASAAARDLAGAREFLADPARRAAAAGLALGPAAGRQAAADRASPTESVMTARIDQALAAAGVAHLRSGVTAGDPTPVPDSDFAELKVFLRFDALTLRELTGFLHHLAASDAGSRAQMIELGPAEIAPGGGNRTTAAATSGDRWAADVTVAYLVRGPTAGRGQR